VSTLPQVRTDGNSDDVDDEAADNTDVFQVERPEGITDGRWQYIQAAVHKVATATSRGAPTTRERPATRTRTAGWKRPTVAVTSACRLARPTVIR
jgi:hypothetical protein